MLHRVNWQGLVLRRQMSKAPNSKVPCRTCPIRASCHLVWICLPRPPKHLPPLATQATPFKTMCLPPPGGPIRISPAATVRWPLLRSSGLWRRSLQGSPHILAMVLVLVLVPVLVLVLVPVLVRVLVLVQGERRQRHET